MLKWYPQFGLLFVWEELPMAEGYAYLSGAISLDGWAQFSGLKPEEGETYIEKETDKLVKIAKDSWRLI